MVVEDHRRRDRRPDPGEGLYNETKVPLLGDIPMLGYLFKYSTKTKRKTNLLILLTPYIIKDQLDLADDSRAQVARALRSSFARSPRSTR